MLSTTYDFGQLFTNTEQLLKGQSNVSIQESLNGKEVVGLYFSAHWCPPCRGFTPKLANTYSDLIQLGKSFEIVFLSSDRSENDFQEYYKEMPWLALPYSQRDLKSSLSQKYKCQGIPYLVLLDGKTGEIITLEGRSAVSYGPQAFPFAESDIERSKKEKKEKKSVLFNNWKLFESSFDVLQLSSKEAVAVFVGCGTGISGIHVFGALLKAFNALQGRLAVIYVPSNVTDHENEKKFVEKMPSEWFKVQQNSQVLADLKQGFDIEDPLTIVLNGSGTEIYNEEASRIIYDNKQGGFPWSEEALAAEKKSAQEKLDKFKESVKGGGLKFLEDTKFISNNKDQNISLENLKTKELVGLYFSAHWCGPCRSFTPKLVEQYNKLKQDGKNLEIVFVSWDKDQSSFDQYFSEMPWQALDFSQTELKDQLSDGFEVDGIPYLMWINPSTGEINENGRQTITDYGAEYYPWTPELVKQAEQQKEEREALKKAEKQQKIKDIEQGWKEAKTVIVKNHLSPGGMVHGDYTLQFEKFNTFVADIKLTNGQYYYEVTVKQIGSAPQMGWITDGFYQASENYTGSGVGDDAYSFGVDGDRVLSWYNGNKKFGQKWENGDVIGFAFDTNAKLFTISVNGSYDSPNGLVYPGDDIKCEVPWVSPGLTSQSGQFKVNFGDQPFKFAPPSSSYKSVHLANLENLALYE